MKILIKVKKMTWGLFKTSCSNQTFISKIKKQGFRFYRNVLIMSLFLWKKIQIYYFSKCDSSIFWNVVFFLVENYPIHFHIKQTNKQIKKPSQTNFLASKKVFKCRICQAPMTKRMQVWPSDHQSTLEFVLSLVWRNLSSRYCNNERKLN